MTAAIRTLRPGLENRNGAHPADGQLIAMPDKNGVLRVVSSAKARVGKTTVFYYAAVPTGEAMPSYYHQEAYTAFIVFNGRFQFWNGDKGHELSRGDFAFIPPVSESCRRFLLLCWLISIEC